ncbi:MAG: accessory factor UbiK family protein [Gammaproteobacteria bacterium]|nr:accessory factor UbiK family protein [Gammaproteobacteria bacterium]
MIDHQQLEDLIRSLSQSLPDGAQQFRRDIENNLQAVLSQFFARLDLVTREELEVQKEVLARTRQRLEQLEQQLARLEQSLTDHQP